LLNAVRYGLLVRAKVKEGTVRRAGLVVALSIVAVLISSDAALAKSALTKTRLASAMLALSDMPTGWATLPITASDTKPDNTGACNKPNSFARAQSLRSTANAVAAFAKDPQTGPAISEVAFAFRTAKDARKFMAPPDFSCGEFDVDGSNGVTYHYTGMGLLSFPKVGDQTLAIRSSRTPRKGDATGTKTTQDTVAARLGSTVIVVSRTGLSPDTDELSTYVTKAYNKLLGVTGASSSAKAPRSTTTTAKTLSYPDGSPVLAGYPKLVPLSSIDNRVHNWFTLQPPPSDQVVELAPGVFAPYNPAVTDLGKYLDGPVDGDCAVRNQYFPTAGGSCWNGVPAA
jgi:hypothetical protein